ncbi:MAG: TolC family protein [Armatimonadetes bacterium]|nr:TolC family protein [Armatimonadota bacterium]
MQNRPAVKAAKLRIDQAKLSARALGAPPSTKIGVGYSTNPNIGATDQDAFLSQPVDIFGRTQAGRQSGSALVEQAEASYLGEVLDIQTDVLEALTVAVAANKLSATADSILQNAEQVNSAVQKKLDAGRVPEVQLTRASIEVVRAKQNSDLRRSEKRAALTRLSMQLGQEVKESDLTDFPNLIDLTNPNVAQRPELLALAADIKAANAEGSLARANARPELELQGLRSPWGNPGSQFGARIQFSWAFSDSGKSRNERRSAERKAQATAESLRDATAKAEAELSASLQELAGAKSQIDSYASLIESTRTLMRKTQIGYDQGASTLLDMLEATRALREVEEGSILAMQRYTEAKIAVYRATGVLLGGAK